MSEIIKTYGELLVLNKTFEGYAIRNPEDKLTAAIKKFYIKQFSGVLADYNDKLDTLRIINCLTDPITKAILRDEKGEKLFSIEGSLKFKEDCKKILKEEVKIIPFILEGIDDLALLEEERELFSGIIIP